jgi:hypothetical protein
MESELELLQMLASSSGWGEARCPEILKEASTFI